MTRNADEKTVADFGNEWARFDQTGATDSELETVYNQYFAVFPWSDLPANAVGFDAGCGSGRWARFVAPRVGKLVCVDASEKALNVARRNLTGLANCEFRLASVDDLPFPDGSMDFGYSLGVLHHVPDTEAGIRSCVDKLKRGAPFLLYLYYAFDNRPFWYRVLWTATDKVRQLTSKLPAATKEAFAEAVAVTVYWPLARFSALCERIGLGVEDFPLSYYRHRSFYTMRTDALDRFGTRLEQRFSADTIRGMMRRSGLGEIRFHNAMPFWCAVGRRLEDASPATNSTSQ